MIRYRLNVITWLNQIVRKYGLVDSSLKKYGNSGGICLSFVVKNYWRSCASISSFFTFITLDEMELPDTLRPWPKSMTQFCTVS